MVNVYYENSIFTVTNTSNVNIVDSTQPTDLSDISVTNYTYYLTTNSDYTCKVDYSLEDLIAIRMGWNNPLKIGKPKKIINNFIKLVNRSSLPIKMRFD